VAFGKVVSGMEVLRAVEQHVASAAGSVDLSGVATIDDCGVVQA
jgi:hypothetical protein